MKKLLLNFLKTFRANIKSIVTAVIASAVIWLAISFQFFPDITHTVSDIPVQINIDTLQSGLRLAEDYVFYTNVRVEGKRYAVGLLSPNDFIATLDLSNVEAEGEYTARVLIVADSDMEFTILPYNRTTRIRIERVASKTLEITAKADNIRLVEGKQIDEANLTANPPTVTISGEKSLIDLIVSAEVHAVHEDEMFASLDVPGKLHLLRSNGVRVENPDIALSSENFTVTVPVHKVKTLPLDFIITGSPSNFNIAGLRNKMVISPGELTLSAPNDSIDHLSYFEVGEIPLAEIDRNMLRSITRDTIEPKLPEGYKNISGQASFALHFEDVEDYEQFEFPIPRQNITILNKPDGFNVDILTQELTVTVLGPAAVVQAMSVNDISVTLNLFGSQIPADTLIVPKTVQCRIRGGLTSAWVVGYPQVDVSFARVLS